MAIRTLVVDDSVLFRKVLSEAVSSFPCVELLGTAPSGRLALRKLENTPADLVFLDVHMEDLGGVETLAVLRSQHPDTLAVMVSGISTRGAEETIRALEMGAVDFIRKPEGRDYQENLAQLKADLRNVFRLVELRVLGRCTDTSAAAGEFRVQPKPVAPLRPAAEPPAMLGIIAIGVSTGGPEALARLIPALPEDLGLPVVLVQHMPPHFTRSLAESLSKKSRLKVVEAAEAMPLLAGSVYIAPGGYHLTVNPGKPDACCALNQEPPENSCRPSVDVLFRSVARAFEGRGVLSVVLTGMGSDGRSGVEALKKGKCWCITQSEKSCVIYGMPRAVDETGLSDESLDLERIAPRLTELARTRRPNAAGKGASCP